MQSKRSRALLRVLRGLADLFNILRLFIALLDHDWRKHVLVLGWAFFSAPPPRSTY